MAAQIKLFYSYAHEDEPWRDQLEKHLSSLQQQNLIQNWHDRKISPGQEWAHAITTNIEEAHIILPLISADFLASPYCSQTEVPLALKKHEAGTARVIPIILRKVNWQRTALGKLQALPPNGQPIASSQNIDEAFYQVALGIEQVVQELIAHPLPNAPTVTQLWNLPFGRNPTSPDAKTSSPVYTPSSPRTKPPPCPKCPNRPNRPNRHSNPKRSVA